MQRPQMASTTTRSSSGVGLRNGEPAEAAMITVNEYHLHALLNKFHGKLIIIIIVIVIVIVIAVTARWIL